MADLARLTIQVQVRGGRLSREQLMGLSASAERAGNSVDRMSDQVRNSGRNLNTFASSLRTVGRDLISVFTVPITAAATASARFGLQLNQGLAGVQTLLTGTFEENTARIMEFRDAVTEASTDFGVGFMDLTDGLYASISAFQDGEDAIETFNLAVRAGVAGAATTEDAINLLSAVTKAYGTTTVAAQRQVANFAFEAVRLGQTTFPELANAVQVVTDRTSRLGVSQEELFAVMAVLTGVTGDASIVATQLRSALDSILNPTMDLTELFDELGVVSGAQLIEQRGLIGAFEAIEMTATSLSAPLQTYIRRLEGITAVSRLANQQNERYNDALEAITNSTTALDDAFFQQQNGINETGTELARLRQTFEVVGAELSEVFLPALVDALEGLATALQNLRSFLGDEAIVAISTFLASLGPITLFAGRVTRAISLVRTLAMSIPAAVGVGAAGLGTLAAATGAALVGLQVYINATENLNDEEVNVLETAAQLRAQTDLLRTSQGDAAVQLQNLIDRFPQLEGVIDPATDSFETAAEAIDNFALGQVRTEFGDTFREIASLELRRQRQQRTVNQLEQAQMRLLEDLRLQYDDSAEGIAAYNEEAQRIMEGNFALQSARSELERLSQVAAEVGGRIAEPFEEAGIEAQVSARYGAILQFVQETADEQNMVTMNAEDTRQALVEVTQEYRNGGQALRNWREIFSDITGTDLTRFARVFTDPEGEEGNRIFTGTEQAAAEAYLGVLREARQEGEELFTATILSANSIDQGFNIASNSLETATNQADTLRQTILQLEAVPREAFQNEEEFNASRRVIQLLRTVLQGLTEDVQTLTDELAQTELSQQLEMISNLNVAGRITRGQAATMGIDLITQRLIVLEQQGRTTSEEYARLMNTLRMLESETPMFQFQGISTFVSQAFMLNTIFEQLGTNSIAYRTALREIIEANAVAFGTGVINGLTSVSTAFAEAGFSAEGLLAGIGELGRALVEALPQLFLQAGLTAISMGLVPLGIGLLAASAAFAVGSGVLQGLTNRVEEENRSAMGNAFASPLQRFQRGGAFTNSIVNVPTRFRFQRGTGLLGEAGAEGILPLRRMRGSGALGVEASGTGNQVAPVNIQVINQTNAAVETQESMGPGGERQIMMVVRNVVNQQIASGQMDSTLRGRFGIRPQGI